MTQYKWFWSVSAQSNLDGTKKHLLMQHNNLNEVDYSVLRCVCFYMLSIFLEV